MFAKNHNAMQLKTGKMQGGCRWELIPHDEDGLTVREIATGNTYEAVKAVTKQGCKHPIPMAIHQSPSVYWGFKDIRIFCLIVFFYLINTKALEL